jgi:hypothetical protein
MRAAYPFIDDFLPAGTLASLEKLGEILAGSGTKDIRRVDEAAAHVPVEIAELAGSIRALSPPPALDRPRLDPSAARPLEEHR